VAVEQGIVMSNGNGSREASTRGTDPLDHLRIGKPETQLLGAILEWVIVDLRRPSTCVRNELARAWVIGIYSCGCPHEHAGMSLAEVAQHLRIDTRELRQSLLKTQREHPRRRRTVYCRDVKQIELGL
jgi:hypothetical protein